MIAVRLAPHRVRERRETVDMADDFLYALDAQHVAYRRPRFDNAEGDSALCEFCVQRQQHPRAGHVDVWRGREITDYHLEPRRP